MSQGNGSGLLLFLLLILLLIDSPLLAQQRAHPLGQHIQFLKLESKALSGNLIGDPMVREVMVMLPPSYFARTAERFPAVYLLHGLGARKDGHLMLLSVLVEMFNVMKRGELSEMILIAVDGATVFGGSYYANSPTIGNYEEYTAREVVRLVDQRFRTRRTRDGRAVGGFSMGGHGAIKLAMKYADVYSQIGSLSGSPMSIRFRRTTYRSTLLNHKKPESLQQLIEEVSYEKNWNLAAAYAKAAAFSPNPGRPPLYMDLPFESTSRDEDDPVWQLWWDDDPLALVSRYARNLRTLDLIYVDHGDDETTLGTEDFVRELVRYGIGCSYHIFRGDHADNMNQRYLRMLRVFSLRWGRERQ